MKPIIGFILVIVFVLIWIKDYRLIDRDQTKGALGIGFGLVGAALLISFFTGINLLAALIFYDWNIVTLMLLAAGYTLLLVTIISLLKQKGK